MATVVIRLLIIIRFHVSKMDADSEKRRRELISRREKRWSMNSQRLEQIMAIMMRPISDFRRSFDTDVSSLLEEYLTEAGLRALEEDPDAPLPDINFPECALVLQQSANIYGCKVDLLYQHTIECSESLHSNTDQHVVESSSPSTPHARRRRVVSTLIAGWARIELERCAASRREADLRPPPTLPRMYIELEPRVLAPCDVPLLDYAGEPVGLLQDFNVTWRLHGGLLVDELECGELDTSATLRPVPLSELQASIELRAPPSPPPPPSPVPPDLPPPPPSSTPIPTEAPPPPPDATPVLAREPAPEPAAPLRQQRKRKQEDPELFHAGAGKIHLTEELRAYLVSQREFTVDEAWVSRVVAARCATLLAARARARDDEITEFRGFDEVDKSDLVDIGGFLGWTAREAQLERLDATLCLSRLASVAESDDDGFFEQSSFGSEGSRPESTPPPSTPPPPQMVDYAAAPEWVSWRAGVVERAAAGEARGLDVRALGAAVLHALPADRREARPFDDVLCRAAQDSGDVSRLFLATLFLANAGNVEVVQGPPLSLSSFSLRLVSRDESLFSAAAADDPVFRDS